MSRQHPASKKRKHHRKRDRFESPLTCLTTDILSLILKHVFLDSPMLAIHDMLFLCKHVYETCAQPKFLLKLNQALYSSKICRDLPPPTLETKCSWPKFFQDFTKFWDFKKNWDQLEMGDPTLRHFLEQDQIFWMMNQARFNPFTIYGEDDDRVRIIHGEYLNMIHPACPEFEMMCYGLALPPEIGRFKSLLKLDLNVRGLSYLPPEIGELVALEEVSISGSMLQTLPPEVGAWKKLVLADFINNKLEELPPQVGQWKHLKTALFNQNCLRKLPPQIGSWKKLTTASFSENYLSSLPSEVGEWKELTEVFLSRNWIEALPVEVGNWKKLIRVEMVKTGLSSLPEEAIQWKHVRILNLSKNRLVDLPQLTAWTSLFMLNLSHNWFRKQGIPSLSGMTGLKYLNMECNQLTSFPKGIGSLVQLQELDLSSNCITKVPSQLGRCTNLNKLKLEENDISRKNMGLLGLFMNLREIHVDGKAVSVNERDNQNTVGWRYR